jgi:hypothetical protein
MQHYAVLSLATFGFLLLTWLIWWKTKSIAFLIGNAFLYLWSLYGAWFIVRDTLNGDTDAKYQYLHFKLFPIYLDSDYLWAIVLYAIFVLVVQCTVLCVVKERRPNQVNERFTPIHIDHMKMIAIGAASGLLGYLIIRDSLAGAAAMNASGYVYVKSQDSPVSGGLYTIFQLMNRTALIALVLGIAVYLSGKHAKYLRGTPNVLYLGIYLSCLGGIFLLNLMLGERSELVTAACLAGLLYIANTPKPSKLLIISGGLLALTGLAVVGFTRGSSLNALFSGVGLEQMASSVLEMSVSVEWFAPHYSLYGAIHKNVPFTYGTSLSNLLLSVVPRLIWPDRPADIYEHYATHVNAVQDQGYAIHHATGWYLNFGVFGVIAGALVWGWVWAKLYNRFNELQRSKFYVGRIFAIIGVWSFTADIPTIIRAGLEGYKPLFIQSFFIPVAIVTLASLTVIQRAGRLKIAFGRVLPDRRLRMNMNPVADLAFEYTSPFTGPSATRIAHGQKRRNAN